MGEPISRVTSGPDDGALLAEWQELLERPGHREAIERTLELLRALSERGYLDTARAAVDGEPAVQEALATFLRESRNVPLARNLRALYELLSCVDLEALRRTPAAPGGRGRRSAGIGLLEIRRRLRDPDVAAGLRAVLDALASVGRSLREP